MKKIFTLFFPLVLLAGYPPSLTYAADGWLKYSQIRSLSKKMRRAGKSPSSVSCRNSPNAKVTARPQIKVVWKKSSSVKNWAIFMHKGTQNAMPFNPLNKAAKKGWRKLNGNSFRAGHSNATYRCYFWLKRG